MHQFNEHHPEFKGFSDYFHSQIAPKLTEREGDREEVLAKTRLNAAIAKVEAEIAKIAKKYGNPNFTENAPEAVAEERHGRHATFSGEKSKLEQAREPTG